MTRPGRWRSGMARPTRVATTVQTSATISPTTMLARNGSTQLQVGEQSGVVPPATAGKGDTRQGAGR